MTQRRLALILRHPEGTRDLLKTMPMVLEILQPRDTHWTRRQTLHPLLKKEKQGKTWRPSRPLGKRRAVNVLLPIISSC